MKTVDMILEARKNGETYQMNSMLYDAEFGFRWHFDKERKDTTNDTFSFDTFNHWIENDKWSKVEKLVGFHSAITHMEGEKSASFGGSKYSIEIIGAGKEKFSVLRFLDGGICAFTTDMLEDKWELL